MKDNLILNDLNFPETYFLDCVGSYLASIFRNISRTNDNSYLYALSQYRLEFTPLDVIKVKKDFNGNPWGYQPIKINDASGKDLYVGDWYYAFLNANFHIDVLTLAQSELEKNVSNTICEAIEKNKYVIIGIDEFYNPESKKYFNKIHNPHGLLIKGFRNKEFIIIDTECSSEYAVSFDDLTNSFFKSSFDSRLYIVDGTHFCKKVNSKDFLSNHLLNHKDFSYLLKLVDLMKTIFSKESEDSDFFLRGINFSFLFKILPVYKMQLSLITDVYQNNKEALKLANEMVDSVINISFLIHYKIQKKDYKLNDVIEKIEFVYKLQNELMKSL